MPDCSSNSIFTALKSVIFLFLFTAVQALTYPCLAFDDDIQNQSDYDSIQWALKQPVLDATQIDSLNTRLGRYIRPRPGSAELLQLAKEVHDKTLTYPYQRLIITAKLNLNTAYLSVSNIAEGLRYSLEALEAAKAIRDTLGIYRSLMQTGIGYYVQKNYERSLEFYKQALEIAESTGDEEKINRIEYLTAIDLTQLNQYNTAIQKFLKVLDYQTARKDTMEMTQVQVYLAELYLKMNNPAKALSYVLPGYEYLVKNELSFGRAKAESLMAQAYYQMKDYNKALSFGKSSIRVADSLNAYEIGIEAYKALYNTSRQLGDFENALAYSERYYALKDTVFNHESSRIIADLESSRLVAQKQSEILLLEKEKYNQDLMLKGSILLGLMFLLLFIVLYSRYIIRQRSSRELAKAYENLRNTQEQLISHEKMASLGQLTAGIAHEIKNPLNFVTNFSSMSMELISELRTAGITSEQEELLRDLTNNIEKIHKHGQRADSIVKNMLEHSRTGNAEKSLNDLNRICSEYFNLAYQGIRAQYPAFSCDIYSHLDPTIPMISIAPQEISRVLINLFNNAFYAVQKRAGEEQGFRPRIELRTQLDDGYAIISIRDNGTGIPVAIREKIFEPFFTTKPAGQGTGLGLSISYEIISAHGGKMEVDAEEGQFTEFTIILPIQ